MSVLTWDEPAGACSPRGWLRSDGMAVGFYLDYGPDHYRTEHASEVRTVTGPRMVTWCMPGHLCADCQPGSILAVRYPGGPSDYDGPRASRYVESVAQARAFCETGDVLAIAA